MPSEILIALLSFAGTIIGSLAGVFSAARLTNYRIEQLEKKVDKHNNLVERMYAVEDRQNIQDTEMKVVNHRIADLEAKAG